jgi:putative transposase
MAEEIGNLRQAAKVLEDIVRMRIDMEKDLKCKYCGSHNIVRNGSFRQVQRFLCRSCGRGFTHPDNLPKAQFSVAIMGSALDGYFSGMSLKKTGRHIYRDNKVMPSHDSIYKWIVQFVPIANKEAEKHIPQVSGRWICDETVIPIAGKKLWLHTCIDSRTRFFLASHLSHTRTTKDSRVLLEKAEKRAGGYIPLAIITDGLRSYIDAVEQVFGSDTKHIQSSPFETEYSTNIIERWHGTLKDRIKTLRGLHNLYTARVWLDGFELDYNFFRPHESLNNETPAKRAGIRFPFDNWTDIVRSKAYPKMELHIVNPSPSDNYTKRNIRSQNKAKRLLRHKKSIPLSNTSRIASCIK